MALDGTVTPAVTDKDGNVVASWIAEAMKKTPYTAETTVNVVVTASDGSMKDMIPVTMKFSMIDRRIPAVEAPVVADLLQAVVEAV